MTVSVEDRYRGVPGKTARSCYKVSQKCPMIRVAEMEKMVNDLPKPRCFVKRIILLRVDPGPFAVGFMSRLTEPERHE